MNKADSLHKAVLLLENTTAPLEDPCIVLYSYSEGVFFLGGAVSAVSMNKHLALAGAVQHLAFARISTRHTDVVGY